MRQRGSLSNSVGGDHHFMCDTSTILHIQQDNFILMSSIMHILPGRAGNVSLYKTIHSLLLNCDKIYFISIS